VPHFDALLDAELASLNSEKYSAVQLYEVAVLFANRLGYVQDHALAHELYGEFLARLEGTQDVRDARLHLLEAIKLYESWGARAKADLMRKKHYQLMQPSREFSLVSTRR
jgi:histidine kinase